MQSCGCEGETEALSALKTLGEGCSLGIIRAVGYDGRPRRFHGNTRGSELAPYR